MEKSNAEKRWAQLAIYFANEIIECNRKSYEGDFDARFFWKEKEHTYKSVLDKMMEIEKDYPILLNSNSNLDADDDWLPEDIYGNNTP